MAPTTDPTIRNATNMPTAIAATLNQRIRRILSRQGSVLSLAILPDLARSGRTAGARRGADRYAGAMQALGIDIGGSGIKAAPVDVTTGKFLADRQKIATPRPALPDAVADVVKQLTTAFSWSGPIGITFPGVVTDGVTRTAANLDPAWIGVDAAALFGTAASNPVRVLNDADAAGVAEMTFGAGLGQKGTVLMLTFGTGIGSALFTSGVLVPNTEFGHIEIRGHDAETRASERAKELHDLSWGKWAGRVDEYLQHIEALLSPHLIIVGGGISKQSDKWVPRLTGIRARVVPAKLLNDAGIVGAAMATSSESAPDTSGATGTGR
jgi:polyphosphate glucokinase